MVFAALLVSQGEIPGRRQGSFFLLFEDLRQRNAGRTF
jgi:hypothetical protein